MRDGERLLVQGRYKAAARILTQLRVLMPPLPPAAPQAERDAARRAQREASLRLLVQIREHRVALQGAAEVGFLRELYPERPSFVLPLVHAQELHGAWRRYTDGVPIAVLGFPLHPLYGTYLPTRSDHLELFGTWLSRYQGTRDQAWDIGTGSGVLAFMACRVGFAQVLATDDNPNAVESVTRELRRRPSPIEVLHGDLFCGDPRSADLVVFNPPWVQGEGEGLLDHALSFGPGLFPSFFDQALERLRPDGRIVLVFSNVMELLQPELPNPILQELERGRLRLVEKLTRRAKPVRGGEGRPGRPGERVEVWELARL